MADDNLVGSWLRTEAHLLAAVAALGEVEPQRLEFTREFLDNNELGLALGEIAHLAEQVGAAQPCWDALHLAALEMKLTEESAHHRALRLVRSHIRT